MSFLEEIKRRKVIQVAVIYAITAWVLVQIVATVEAPLQLPEWVDTLAILLLAIGFPITLIMTWAYDLTPEGLVRDRGSAEPEAEAVAESAPKAERDQLPNSIAVLPFENLSPDPDDAYFAAGMHEQLLNELAKVRDVNVIARTSVLRYASDPQPVPEIAEALNVQTVMEGSVRYAGEKVRITAQLIHGRSGTHLWNETYDGDLSDIFAIQTDIATAIAGSLEAELLPETRVQLEKPPTESPAAYALYLEASNILFTGHPNVSIALLDRATKLDPDFALAFARKGYVRTWMLVNAEVPAPTDPSLLQELERGAIEDADRALAIDENLGAAWLVRAQLNQLTWHWKAAEDDFARAYALSPNDPFVMREYALFKAQKGQCEKAKLMARRQVELNPNDVATYSMLDLVASVCRDFEEALRAAEQARKLAPGSPLPFSLKGHAHVAMGDFAAAEAEYRTAENLITDESGIYMPGMVYGYGLMSRADDATRLFKRFQTWAETHAVGTGGWIYAYLGIRDADKAYEWLGRAVEVVERGEPDAGYIAFPIIKNNVHNDPILEQPRFRKLLDKIDTIARSR
jgi:TolB-like protein/cytochrome c-type biogenesis protein CcmH/NrfG